MKSMLGEAPEHLDLEARGVAGDRVFAVRDASGKLGSGKDTRRFRRIDGLFAFRAEGALPEVVFPDGRRVRGDDAGIHAALSRALGLEVVLAREGDVSHLDQAPVHLVTTASLEWLKRELPDSVIDARRFRPNLLVEVPGTAQVERDWIGRTLAVGQARLEIRDPTERCRMTTLAQTDLPEDSRVLTCLGRRSDLQFGVYANVAVPGRVRTGDAVRLI